MKSILLQHVVGFVRDHPLLIGGNGEGGDSARGGADLLVVPQCRSQHQAMPIVCIPLHGFAAGFSNAGRQRRDSSFQRTITVHQAILIENTYSIKT